MYFPVGLTDEEIQAELEYGLGFKKKSLSKTEFLVLLGLGGLAFYWWKKK